MVWQVFKKVRELFAQVLDLFCLIKELCRQVGDLWRELHVASGWAGEVDKSRWQPQSVLKNVLSRAYIYGLRFPEKSIHPFTQSAFPVDFHRFPVWRFGFQSIHTGGERWWRAEKASLHTGKPLKIRKYEDWAVLMVWRLENPTLHTLINWKSDGNVLRVKGWMLFLG